MNLNGKVLLYDSGEMELLYGLKGCVGLQIKDCISTYKFLNEGRSSIFDMYYVALVVEDIIFIKV